MTPPMQLSPLVDKKGGFTTWTKLKEEVWKSSVVLDGRDQTILEMFHDGVYNNQPAVKAYYHLHGYCCPILAWFHPDTNERLD